MQHGGGGWSANVFFACGWIGLLIFLRNEKKQCAKCAWVAKSVTEKKQQQGGLCGSLQKDCASHEVRMVRIFAGWGLCPDGAARNELSGENLTAFGRTLFPRDFIPISQLK